MQITSSEFGNNKAVPSKYTCDGEDVSPPLEIKDAPEETQSFVLIVDDPDAPGQTWDHWVVWNIPANTGKIEEDSVPGEQGVNDFGRHDWGGPCPPSGTHRYFFKLYALDTILNLESDANKEDVEDAIEGHILEQAELIGLYKRS